MKKIRKQIKQRVILFGAKVVSVSKNRLANALQAKLPDMKVLKVSLDSKTFTPRETDITINWGSGTFPVFYNSDIDWKYHYNDVTSVKTSINKLETFRALQEHCNIPEWTTNQELAYSWLEKEAIMARTKLNGFGGEGCYYIPAKDDVNFGHDFADPVQLFVKYKKKRHEYRVHVLMGQIIDISWKRKRKDFEGELNTKIRNLENGWVYCRENIEIPHDIKEQAIAAVDALDLNFGAVDIIWNEKENKSYVLEVNSAPGIEGTSLENYAEAFANHIRQIR